MLMASHRDILLVHFLLVYFEKEFGACLSGRKLLFVLEKRMMLKRNKQTHVAVYLIKKW